MRAVRTLLLSGKHFYEVSGLSQVRSTWVMERGGVASPATPVSSICSSSSMSYSGYVYCSVCLIVYELPCSV